MALQVWFLAQLLVCVEVLVREPCWAQIKLNQIPLVWAQIR